MDYPFTASIFRSSISGRRRSAAAQISERLDYINLSGVLYHVTSPIDVVAAARTLLRPNGLMLVSTIVQASKRCFMEFNDTGRFQKHGNTFWYLSTGFVNYMLRMLSLAPVDALYFGDDDAGYAAVLCRATDAPIPEPGDETMPLFLNNSLELEEWRQQDMRLPPSDIALKSKAPVVPTSDLPAFAVPPGSESHVSRSQDAHVLMLEDVD